MPRVMEIAYRFGPKIKQMFVLVLLHSYDGQEGISTNKLSAQLWPEKTTTSAKIYVTSQLIIYEIS